MAGSKNFWVFEDDFISGSAAFPVSAEAGARWVIDDTSSAGAPSHGFVDGAGTGEYKLQVSATSEATTLALGFGDVLPFKAPKVQRAEFIFKLSGVLLVASSKAHIAGVGLVGVQNNTLASTLGVLAYVTGDGVSNKLTLQTRTSGGATNLVTSEVITDDTFYRVVLDLQDPSSVKFYGGHANELKPLGKSTKFDFSAYTVGLQPIAQINKGAGTEQPQLTLDYVRIEGER
jgi:hypothetical protein